MVAMCRSTTSPATPGAGSAHVVPAPGDVVEETRFAIGAGEQRTRSRRSTRPSAASSSCPTSRPRPGRVHERLGAVEELEIGDELVDRRFAADPAREAEAVPEPAREIEDVERSRLARARSISAAIAQSRLSRYPWTSSAPKRSCANVRAPGEQLVGQLAHEHAVVGEALARVAFLDRVERPQPGLAEREEIGDAARTRPRTCRPDGGEPASSATTGSVASTASQGSSRQQHSAASARSAGPWPENATRSRGTLGNWHVTVTGE